MSAALKRMVVGVVLTVSCILGQSAQAAGPNQAFEPEGGRTSVPYGWVDFCNRYAGECEKASSQATDVSLTPAAMKDIEKVNRFVNASVQSVTDLEHWGVADRWDYPADGKGDCEDYVLLKRKMLIERGYPQQDLLVTVVKDHEGEGHAILTVKTSKGDYTLDNLSDRVQRWDATGYRFVKRQSQDDPNRWVSLGAPSEAPLFTAR